MLAFFGGIDVSTLYRGVRSADTRARSTSPLMLCAGLLMNVKARLHA